MSEEGRCQQAIPHVILISAFRRTLSLLSDYMFKLSSHESLLQSTSRSLRETWPLPLPKQMPIKHSLTSLISTPFESHSETLTGDQTNDATKISRPSSAMQFAKKLPLCLHKTTAEQLHHFKMSRSLQQTASPRQESLQQPLHYNPI